MPIVPVLVEDVWVQCDNPDCKKWRKLPPGSKPPPDDVEWCAAASGERLRAQHSAAPAAQALAQAPTGLLEQRLRAGSAVASAPWCRERCA